MNGVHLQGNICPDDAATQIIAAAAAAIGANIESLQLVIADSATLARGHEDSNDIWAAAVIALITKLVIVHTGCMQSWLDMTLLEMLMPICASSDDGCGASASMAETFRKSVTSLELHGDLSGIFGDPCKSTMLSSVVLENSFPNLKQLVLTDDGLQLQSDGRWSPRLPEDLLTRLPYLTHLCIPTDTCAENLFRDRPLRLLTTLTVWDAVICPNNIGRLSALTCALYTTQLDVTYGEANAAGMVNPSTKWAIIGRRRINNDKNSVTRCVDLVMYSYNDAKAVLSMLDPDGMPGMTLVLELTSDTPEMLRLVAERARPRGSLQRIQIMQLKRKAALPDARLIGECAEAARCACACLDLGALGAGRSSDERSRFSSEVAAMARCHQDWPELVLPPM